MEGCVCGSHSTYQELYELLAAPKETLIQPLNVPIEPQHHREQLPLVWNDILARVVTWHVFVRLRVWRAGIQRAQPASMGAIWWVRGF